MSVDYIYGYLFMFFSDSLFLSIVNAEPDMMFSWNPPVNLFCRRKQEIDQRFFYLNLGAQKILEGMSSVIYFTASQSNKTLFLDFFLFKVVRGGCNILLIYNIHLADTIFFQNIFS